MRSIRERATTLAIGRETLRRHREADMGYILAHGACIGCNRLFAFNPHKVPSIPIKGTREPICQACVDIVNPRRVANGLEPIKPARDAYEPIDENEL